MKELVERMRFEKGRGLTQDRTKSKVPRNGTISRPENSRCGVQNLMKAVLVLVACSLSYVLFSAMMDSRSSPNKGIWAGLYDFQFFEKDGQLLKDKLLGGLLTEGFNENSCLSRYQSALYHKKQIKKPSSHLISRLRNYEAMHKRCGPHTESYNRTLEVLKSGQYNGTATTGDCKYIVSIGISGLGNKMLTMASAFLYALLTNRVLLVDGGGYIPDLFCEPFPEVSWFLPSDFPIIEKFSTFHQRSPHSYGNMIRHNGFATSPPPFVYLHMVHDYTTHDKLFFCDKAEAHLKKVPWLILKSNNYFVPSLFLIPSFQEELDKFFPEKDAVFHQLGRYLLHPTNLVWGLITRYYDAYLAKADEITGIQIRTFEKNPAAFRIVMDQILACARKENLLPDINDNDKQTVIELSKEPKNKAVLITSLNSGYSEVLRDLYWEHHTTNGDVIQVYQPSHEEVQHTEKQMQNVKALAEMYLLSLADRLVTSSLSTFGYVAQSLGGLRPWILTKPENGTVPDPPCSRAASMEPCFHAPPTHNCGIRGRTDAGRIVPHVQYCEDKNTGLKLFGRQ